MPLYKFGAGDVFYNRIKTHPSSSFYIYSGSVYYNGHSHIGGANASNTPNVPSGYVSLYELNVDRTANADASAVIGVSSSISASQNVPDTGFIYPFVHKGMSGMSFKGLSRESYVNDFFRGDILTGSYMMSSSITRKMYGAAAMFNDNNKDGAALKNSLDYAKRLGDHYDFPSGSSATYTTVIDIPSIFYGSEIKKGSVELKVYQRGELQATLRDSRYNGALIHTGSTTATANFDDEIMGVVLYNEGVVVLKDSTRALTTGNLTSSYSTDYYVNRDNTTSATVAKTAINWVDWGSGLIQGGTDLPLSFSGELKVSGAFSLDFAGTHYVPTVTMLAHANRGELNYTNNPTSILYGEGTGSYHPITSSYYYKEVAKPIKKVHSSSYADPTGSLKKTTYITKVGIYDDKKKLIGIASVAKPVKKTEERDLTFKLKLDI